MTQILWIVFELAVNLFQGIVFAYFICGSLGYKDRNINTKILFSICALLIFSALTISNYLTYFEGVAIFVYFLILFIFSLIFLKGSILKKAFMSLMPINAMAIGSVFSTNLVSFIFKQDIVYLMSQGSFYRIITVAISNGILFLILFIIKKITTNNDIVLDKSEWLFMGIVLCISIVVFMFLYFAIFESESESEYVKLVIALAIFGIIAINTTIYVLLLKLSKKHQIELENSLLKQQYSFQAESMKEVKKQYEILQKTRHDYNNGLRLIQTLNNENNRDKINEYISKYLETQNHSVRIISTNNDYLNAIVNSKLTEANTKNIDVKVSVISDIECSNNIDLCNIIGNMFDNAIEACQKCSHDRTIQLDIQKNNDNILILMKNSIPDSVLKENPELVTDKKNKFRHGYGTKIIKELAEKYHGFADFYEQDRFFCCNVCLVLE